ncbi:MAG: hypothetical protein IRZ18_09125 [Clostridia bacterium]|nr:hypothetical protein [Clostridia bacterium]
MSSEFQFTSITLDTPAATFGPVDRTMPPGFVGNNGMLRAGDRRVVPVRFLHVEPTRVVVDVAGSSAQAERVLQRFREVVDDFLSGDGARPLGEVAGTKDFSILSVELGADLEALIHPAAREVLRLLAGASGPDDEWVPMVGGYIVSAGKEFAGEPAGPRGLSSVGARLTLRRAARRLDRLYYSEAALSSERHLELLNQLEQILEAAAGERRFPEERNG